MKTYKECKVISLGGSNIASLIAVGAKSWSDYWKEQETNENAEIVKMQMIHFGEDGFYRAYIVEDSAIEIGKRYEKVFECRSWLKIYDDNKCVFKSNHEFNEFEIYRAGCYGMIIRCLKGKKVKENKVMLTLDELNKYNEKEERKDTLYLVELHMYRKGRSGYIKEDGNPVMMRTNDYDEALDKFEKEAGYIPNNKYGVLKLKQACGIYDRNLHYETIREFDSHIRDNIYRSLEYTFRNAYNKEDPMFYLESLPRMKDADCDECVQGFIRKLNACIRDRDEDEYKMYIDELVDHYFINQCNYEF